MIVFIDGMDGSGKTTLMQRLLDDLAATGRPVMEAPPLWTFIEPITVPGEFARWVQRTPAEEVSGELVAATVRRLRQMRADTERGTVSPGTMLLADRGPTTALCSAVAHATSARRTLHPGSVGRSDGFHAEMDAAVTRLHATVGVLSVRLDVPDAPDLALGRLASLETLTPTYTAYLRALHEELATCRPPGGLPELLLDAADSLDANATVALARMTGETRMHADADGTAHSQRHSD